MKFVNNCTAAFAAGFSQKFLSSHSYHPDDSSLPELYLGTTGVLLSMCEGPCNDDNFDMDHLSGSWLQNSTTGMRVFMEEGVGIILDPHAVSIHCVYPLDGATADREQKGCGAMREGPGSDPNGFDWRMRLWLYWRKITKFGFSKKWEDIPCSEFFEYELGPPEPPILWDHNNTWTTFVSIYIQSLEAQVGHVICYNDLEPNFDNRDMMLLYAGPEPWKPAEWQDCANTMQAIVQEHPKFRAIWNEVVMDSPDDTGEVVQAVFYINPEYREQAYFEAERLGRKTVLELDPFDLVNLFQCPPKEEMNNEFATEMF